jgi:lipopolysaccharide/colanic/teichoic acid biosynthesis glycosyltransferase
MSITEIQHQRAAFPSGYGPAKRLIDITAAASLLALLAPVLLVIALAVKVETRGPALFRQARCGAGSLSFTALKFRTMHVDAEARLMEMLAVNAELKLEYDRHHKLRDDPRVTRFGRFLRRTSLDELPQLWNVLTGDMSLIGPRPYMPHELAPHPSAQSAIARVRPGITGLWQVSGRHRTTFEDRLQFDIAYVEGYSLRRDMAILLRTVMAVLKADGI